MKNISTNQLKELVLTTDIASTADIAFNFNLLDSAADVAKDKIDLCENPEELKDLLKEFFNRITSDKE